MHYYQPTQKPGVAPHGFKRGQPGPSKGKKQGKFPPPRPLVVLASRVHAIAALSTLVLVLLFSTDVHRIDALILLGAMVYLGIFGLSFGVYFGVVVTVALMKIGFMLGVWGALLLMLGLLTGSDLAWAILETLYTGVLWALEFIQTL